MRHRFHVGRGVVAMSLAWLPTAALGLVLAACGTYGSHTDPIFRGVVGPAGGTVAAGPVTLVIAPGALLADLSIEILPQPDPLPIDPAAGPVEYLPGLHCIGPLGQGLAQPCVVRICYDPADVPGGATLADLVLLEWDDAAQWMRVRGNAIHDTVAGCFEDVFYGELGHIGVGVRTLRFDFVVAAQDPIVGAALGFGFSDLYLGHSGGGIAPQGIPNTSDGRGYVPSGDGRRVLFAVSDLQTDGTSLRAVDVADGSVLFESSPDLFVRASDPLYGWFPGQPTNLFYAHREEPDGFFDVFADDDVAGAAHQNLRNGEFFEGLIDVRIAPDGTMALLRYEDAFGGGQRADVVSTSTGALLGDDLPILPLGPGSPMPRWLPDSSGLTFVDGDELQRIDRDGGGLATLYVAPTTLLDAAVADDFAPGSPAASHVAYLRTTGGQIVSFGGFTGPTTWFGTDVLAGGARVEQDLGADLGVGELAYHPEGTTVWCQLTSIGQIFVDGQARVGTAAVLPPPGAFEFVTVFDAATAATNRVIAAPLGALDIDKVSGDVLLWMQSASQDVQFPQAGLWRLEDDGTGGTTVSLGGLVPLDAPRFLTSWRANVCSSFAAFVR